MAGIFQSMATTDTSQAFWWRGCVCGQLLQRTPRRMAMIVSGSSKIVYRRRTRFDRIAHAGHCCNVHVYEEVIVMVVLEPYSTSRREDESCHSGQTASPTGLVEDL